MEILYARCAGLDAHKKTMRVCWLVRDEQSKSHKEYRTYMTTTQDLLHLLDWLLEAGCRHVALEGTGVYWKLMYNLFEGQIEVLVVNAQHIKAVPERKTDTKDAEWIANLLQHGLLTSSFIPPAEQWELRELTRYRVKLTEERAREVNRVQKMLEGTNLKLGDVVSDVMGKASRMILSAIADGESDPTRLASLAVGRVRASLEQLEAALTGTISDHHRFLLREHLTQIEHLDKAVERITTEIARRVSPPEPLTDADPGPSEKSETVEVAADPSQSDLPASTPPVNWGQAMVLLVSISGINERAAAGILAEIGVNMGQFPSARHLASWAGMCPGNYESGGKRLSGKTRKGSPWLRKLLVEAAHAAAHTKNTYVSTQYRRIASRRGAKIAMIAVGHSLLVMIYHMLCDHVPYTELGGNYFDEHDRQATEMRLVRRLEKLGYQVELQTPTQVA